MDHTADGVIAGTVIPCGALIPPDSGVRENSLSISLLSGIWLRRWVRNRRAALLLLQPMTGAAIILASADQMAERYLWLDAAFLALA